MNTIAIDAVGINQVGGGRTSILNLLKNIFAIDQKTNYIVLLSTPEPTLDSFPNVEQLAMPVINRIAVRLYLQTILPALVRWEGIDLVHFTKDLGVFGLPCPYVITIHDLTILRLHEKHSLIDVTYWRVIEPLTVRRAAQVVSVSRDAARDIERFYGVPEEGIEVIYWAPHERFVPIRDVCRLQNLRNRYNLPEKFILFLGILAKKKNLPTLLMSLAHLHSQRPNVPDLVVVGRRYSQSEDEASFSLVHQLGLSKRVHFTGSVPTDDVPLFYNAAELYVLPSLHEGFGIPCLEAMACGTPVITTSGGALPEIAGNAALILDDPKDVQGLAAAIKRLLYNKPFRQKLIKRGFKRANAFSWEKSAREMLDVYYTALGD